MGQKKQARSTNATMRAVQQRREEQKRRDRRNLFIIVGAVVAILAILGGLVTWALASRTDKDQASAGAFTLTADVEKHAGMVVGVDGPGKATPGAPVVDLYYDYTCGHCVDFEHRMGKDVEKDVKDGTYTLVLHPVLTEALAFQYPATELAVRVFQGQPDKFMELHNALMENVYDAFVKHDTGSLTQDPVAAVRAVGKKVGVDNDILDKVTAEGAQQTLSTWSKTWTSSGLRADQRYGTPMFVRDGVPLEPQTLNDVLPLIRGESTAK